MNVKYIKFKVIDWDMFIFNIFTIAGIFALIMFNWFILQMVCPLSGCLYGYAFVGGGHVLVISFLTVILCVFVATSSWRKTIILHGRYVKN